jgi:hypothetical protein
VGEEKEGAENPPQNPAKLLNAARAAGSREKIYGNFILFLSAP